MPDEGGGLLRSAVVGLVASLALWHTVEPSTVRCWGDTEALGPFELLPRQPCHSTKCQPGPAMCWCPYGIRTPCTTSFLRSSPPAIAT